MTTKESCDLQVASTCVTMFPTGKKNRIKTVKTRKGYLHDEHKLTKAKLYLLSSETIKRSDNNEDETQEG